MNNVTSIVSRLENKISNLQKEKDELKKALQAWDKWADLQPDIPADRLPRIADKTKEILNRIK